MAKLNYARTRESDNARLYGSEHIPSRRERKEAELRPTGNYPVRAPRFAPDWARNPKLLPKKPPR